jgi:hypothetical protein
MAHNMYVQCTGLPLKTDLYSPWIYFNYFKWNRLSQWISQIVAGTRYNEVVLSPFINAEDHIVVYSFSSLEAFTDHEWQKKSRVEKYKAMKRCELSYAEEVFLLLEEGQYASINFSKNCTAIHTTRDLTHYRQIVLVNFRS